jgi:3-deoxy-manno-octulosonate cytidylyltransferase (CMP-KDO synthetase)
MHRLPFTVIIPARLASSRLPNKPLADIHGIPMIVRVAQRAKHSDAKQIVVACDDQTVIDACSTHGVKAVLTRTDHASGSDRLAEASLLLKLSDADIVVNVQGDEPLIETDMINQVARLLMEDPSLQMSTVAHAIKSVEEFKNPNIVKVVLDQNSRAHYFSRAPIPWWRDGFVEGIKTLPTPPPLRHVGLYAYRVGFLRKFPTLSPSVTEQLESLEQLRALSHGYAIGVHVSTQDSGPGVDTQADLELIRQLIKPN